MMDSTQPKVLVPKALEAVTRALIPPACREHVLGDLQERYVSPTRYFVDALRTLPLVIASQIRRTLDPSRFLFDVLAGYIAYLTVVTWADRTILQEPWALWALVTVALYNPLCDALRGAYRRPSEESLSRSDIYLELVLFFVPYLPFLLLAKRGLGESLFVSIWGQGLRGMLTSIYENFSRFRAARLDSARPLFPNSPRIRVLIKSLVALSVSVSIYDAFFVHFGAGPLPMVLLKVPLIMASASLIVYQLSPKELSR